MSQFFPNSRLGSLAAFRYRNYRYFWTATMLGSAGRWMEAVVFGWLILQMTGSPFLVGVVAGCRWIGYAFGPVSGAIADKYDKRVLLLIITSSSVLYSATLALGAAAELLEYWHVIALALFAGIAHGFDLPLRYAFTADIVDKSILTNAVALNTTAVEVTAVLGPAVSGLLINGIGMSGTLWVLTANYAVNVLALYPIRWQASPAKAVEGSVARNLADGLRYTWSTPTVLALVSISLAFSLFQWPLRHALVPVFAADVLRVGAPGYGFLLAASGAGALIGAAAVACRGELPGKTWLCIVMAVGSGLAAGAFCLSPWYFLSLGLMACVGFAETTYSVLNATLLLSVTPAEMRGRVMGVRSCTILPLSVGSLMAGAMASHFGAPTAGLINAVLHVFAIALIVLLAPSLRRFRQ